LRVRIESAGRLHLGFVDLHGGLGRRFGSIGVALNEPLLVLEAAPHDRLWVEGLERERTEAFARRFFERYAPYCGRDSWPCARLRVLKAIPRHMGLGSGTQLALATGVALARLYALDISIADIAETMERGQRSGIGIGAFQNGGFMVDGGRAMGNGHRSGRVPPLIFRQPFPEKWLFVVAIPQVRAGLSAGAELSAFRELAPPSSDAVLRISRILLMKMLPSLVEEEIEPFGEAMTEIDRLVGDAFCSVQGGCYASAICGHLVDHMLEQGAYGAGQSSWGPAVYGLVSGKEQARSLAQAVHRFVAGKCETTVFYTSARNEGFRISTIIDQGCAESLTDCSPGQR